MMPEGYELLNSAVGLRSDATLKAQAHEVVRVRTFYPMTGVISATTRTRTTPHFET